MILPSRLMKMEMDEGHDLVDAERATLFMLDEEKQELWSRVASGMDGIITVKNDQGEMVPNRTAFKQYLPKRYTPAVQERALKRAEATTILGTALDGSEHKVASFTPKKTEAKSQHGSGR